MNPTFEINPAENELRVRLYLHHIPVGPNKNQITIHEPKCVESFGTIAINDWHLTGNLDPNAKVIARAQGMHFQAGLRMSNWYNTFNLVFQDERFEGSTLEVKGTGVTEGEWAIVGGTGKFTKAQGVIYKKKVQDTNDGNIVEVTICATYSPLEKPT